MAYDNDLVQQVRAYLRGIPRMAIEEKKMFGGLAFLVNGKMCINVSGDSLMCRFDPDNLDEIVERRGYRPMVMKGKNLAGYCYVGPEGYGQPEDFSYWLELCLAYNAQAKASSRR
ncbi:TfoX/Sxy family protein [Parapedobacter koreensis]|nr:TfoX/Sxy family protein [Parapedobacter koreensis]